MTNLEAFFPYLIGQVPGASDLQMLQALKVAATTFCEQTNLVQSVQAVNCVADTQDYSLAAPTQQRLSNILAVFHQGRELRPCPPDLVESDVALRGETIGTAVPLGGTPVYFFQKTPTSAQVSLYPIPGTSLTGGVTVKAAWAPTESATQVEDVLFTEFAISIAAGAAAFLHAQPSQPFTNTGSAAGAAFGAAISKARNRKVAGQLTGSVRVQPRAFVVR